MATAHIPESSLTEWPQDWVLDDATLKKAEKALGTAVRTVEEFTSQLRDAQRIYYGESSTWPAEPSLPREPATFADLGRLWRLIECLELDVYALNDEIKFLKEMLAFVDEVRTDAPFRKAEFEKLRDAKINKTRQKAGA